LYIIVRIVIVLLISDEGKEAVILLGEELENGTLDEFGGGRNKGEMDPRETGAREFEEESCGVLCSAEDIKKLFFDFDKPDEENPPGSSIGFAAQYVQFWVRVCGDNRSEHY
jgi:hypothetical protein